MTTSSCPSGTARTAASSLRPSLLSGAKYFSMMSNSFILRPLVKRILTPEEKPEIVGQNDLDGAGVIDPDNPNAGPRDPRLEKAQAAGAARADMVKKVSEMVENSPDEAAAILRNWLQEAA